MLFKLYRATLRLPKFRGQSRITAFLRRQLAPSVTEIDGVRMQLDPMEWAQIDILKYGCLEPSTLALFKRLLHPGDTYIDVGAHVGYHALMARKLIGPTGHILAIEPQPYNCEKLLINASLNDIANITTVVAAVGERDGTIVLHDQVATDKSRLILLWKRRERQNCDL